jgi:hypothetical protein
MVGAVTLLLLAGLVGAGLWLLFAELATPGPSRFTTAVRRYGIWPYLTVVVLLGGVVVFVVRPGWRDHLLSLIVLAIPAVIAASYRRQLLARAVLRARWPSVARSAGLGVLRDIRGRSWPFDSTVTLGNEHVEHLPIISRPRPVPGVGISYRLTPARGGTLDQVAQASEALAAGLRVQRVEVTRTTPSRGQLLAVRS